MPNKIAAGAAVTLFGADETLMERLGDVRNSGEAITMVFGLNMSAAKSK